MPQRLPLILLAASLLLPGTAEAGVPLVPEGYRCTLTPKICRAAPCFNYVCFHAERRACPGAAINGQIAIRCDLSLPARLPAPPLAHPNE